MKQGEDIRMCTGQNKTKTAAEMFSELGWKRKERKSYIRYEKFHSKLVDRIQFEKDIKAVSTSEHDLEFEEETSYSVYLPEILAIQQQIKELGWLS